MQTLQWQTDVPGRDDRLGVDQHLRAIATRLGAIAPTDMAAVRALLRGVATDASLAQGVTAVPVRDAPVPGAWLIPQDADPERRIVYCHGLSFMAGDLETYGGFVSRLAAVARASTLLVDYRLTPEHHYPAAHDDCLTAILWAREQGPDGPAPAKCAVAGDSSGASLAIASALAANRAGTPANAVIVFSPFVDLAVSGESWLHNEGRDPLLTTEIARNCAALYAPGVDPQDLRLSPILDDLSGLPSLQVHASMADPMYDDASRLATIADRAGVLTELHAWCNIPHTWFLFHGELPEARLSIELAGSFVRRM